MIRLLLASTLRDARNRPLRMCLTILISALGCSLVLAGATAMPAATRTVETTAMWLPSKGEGASGPWVATTREMFEGHAINVMRTAPGQSQATPAGLGALPNKGDMFVSPEVARMLAESGTLSQRYPFRIVRVLNEHELEAPRSRRLVIGVDPIEIVKRGGSRVAGFSPAGLGDLRVPAAVQAGAPFMVVCFALPLAWLYGILASLGLERRNRRIASLRLQGASRSLLRRMTLLEAAIPSISGTGLGALVFAVAAPRVSPHLPFGDGVWGRFLSTPWWAWVIAVAAIPILTSVATLRAANSAISRPLFSRRGLPKLPRMRWLPRLVAALGCVFLGASALWPDADAVDIRLILFTLGFVALSTSLVLLSADISNATFRPIAKRAASLPSKLAHGGLRSQSARAVSAATGISVFVMIAGCLLSFFPLLASTTAASDTRAARDLGPSSILMPVGSPSEVAALRKTATIGSVAELHVLSTTNTQTLVVGCSGAIVYAGRTEMDGCSAGKARLTDALAHAARLGPLPVTLVSDTSKEWRHVKGREVQHSVLVQMKAGAALEAFRNDVLKLGTGPVVATLEEVAQDSTRTSRPFEVATILLLLLSALIALCSLALALIEQVWARHRANYHLRVNGARVDSLWRGLLIQAVFTVTPNVMVALAASLVAAASFMRLNGSGALPPLLQILTLGLLAGLIGPVGAVGARHAVATSAQTRPTAT